MAVVAVRPDVDDVESQQSVAASVEESVSRRSHDLLVQAMPPCPLSERQWLYSQVILLNRPLARGIAARYSQRGVELEDLRQVAEMGLVNAVARYEPAHGRGFLAYAVPTIRGEVRRYFRDSGWMIRPPRRIQELRGDVATTEDTLVQTLRRFPRQAETAAQLGLTTPDLFEVHGARGCFRPASLDAPAREDAGLSMGELIGEIDGAYERIDNHQSLTPLLAALGSRDRRILELRFVHGWTQKEIGDHIGVSQMQVSRLLTAVLRRLRERLCTD